MQPANPDIAANDYSRFFAGIATSDGNGTIKFHRLRESMLSIVLFGSLSHQRRVYHEEVATTIILKEFDGAPNHVGQAGLFIAGIDLVRIRKFGGGKSAKKFRTSPPGHRLELGLCPGYIETFSTQFTKQIPFVFPRSVLSCGEKVVYSSAEDQINSSAVRQLAGKIKMLAGVRGVRVKCGSRRVSYLTVAD